MKKGNLTVRVKKWQFVLGICLCAAGIVMMSAHEFMGSRVLAPPIVSIQTPPLEPKAAADRAWPALRAFKAMEDSLQGDPSGKAVYDSLLHLRPGLADSVRKIEDYYSLEKQLKK